MDSRLEMTYKYLSGEAPESKINYAYSVFEGQNFLDSWISSRQISLDVSGNLSLSLQPTSGSVTERLFLKWIDLKRKNDQIEVERLNLLIKRFEVTKRIYSSYDENFRPTDNAIFKEFKLYQLFSFFLCLEYSDSKRLPLLNALIKLNDIVLSLYHKGESLDENLLRDSLTQEVSFVLELR